jgi:peptide/nickel transport system permease protein
MREKLLIFLKSKPFKRFKKNHLAFASFFVVILMVLIAIFGYFIAPDYTTNANSQNLELKLKKPGFCFYELTFDDQKEGSIKNYFFGFPQKSKSIIIYDSFYTENQNLIYKNQFGKFISLPFSEFSDKDHSNKKGIKFLKQNIKKRTFWLGSDNLGRDVLSRLILGARISLTVGFIAVIISLIIGVIMGAMAGYFGGYIDKIIMWFISVFWSIPTVLLSMALLIAFSTQSKYQFLIVFLAVGLTMWVDTARIIRGQVMQLKEMGYIQAAFSMGFSNTRILFKHILPNTYTILLVITSSNFATAILMESGLSYLGLGVQPPAPSWGSMMREYFSFIGSELSYLSIIPGSCIMIAVFAFNAIGNGLRDAFDIKS